MERTDEPEWTLTNRYVLYLVNAILGEIGPGFRAVSLSLLSPKKVKLWFLLEQDRPEVRASIDDIACEFEALASVDEFCVEDIEVTVDARPAHQLTSYFSALGDARRIFLRREPESVPTRLPGR